MFSLESSVTLIVIAIALTKTSRAAKAEISDTPIRQSQPRGFNIGSSILPRDAE